MRVFFYATHHRRFKTASLVIPVICSNCTFNHRSINDPKDAYPKSAFTYDTEQDCYICPAGEHLTYKTVNQKQKRHMHTREGCHTCALQPQCTKANKRWAGHPIKVFLPIWPRCDSGAARPGESILENRKYPALSSGALKSRPRRTGAHTVSSGAVSFGAECTFVAESVSTDCKT